MSVCLRECVCACVCVCTRVNVLEGYRLTNWEDTVLPTEAKSCPESPAHPHLPPGPYSPGPGCTGEG